MTKFLTTDVGRLRALGFVEGLSFIVLVVVGVPMKYFMSDPSIVKSFGPIHGFLFIGFLFECLRIGFIKDWSFWKITIKLLVASVLPFGTFYVDHTILKKMQG